MATKKICREFQVKGLDDTTGKFEGYGSVFGVKDWYRDVVMPGAFTRTLNEHKQKGSMPKLLWQHDSYAPCGIFTEMHEDSKGLYVKGQLLLDVEKGREAYALLKAGAIDAMSIGYATKRYEIVEDENDDMDGVRKLLDVDLWEVSLVTFPANTSALITSVKDGVSEIPTEREIERWLTRDAGFSRSDAQVIINEGFKALQGKRDAAPDGAGDAVIVALKEAMAQYSKATSTKG